MFAKMTKGNSIYAVYDLSNDDEPDRTSMMMVNHSVGKKSGFAPVTFEEMNGHVTRILFDITGKISLREYIGQNISQNDFRSMIINIVDAIEQLDEYMIDIQQIKLDIDSVFINAFDHSISLVCIALKNWKNSDSMYRFFKSVVENSYVTTQMNETSYFNRLWNIVRSDNNFSLSNIRTVLTDTDFSENPLQKQFAGGDINMNNGGKNNIENESSVVTINPENKQLREFIPPVPAIVQEEKKKGILGIFQSRKKKPEKDENFQDGLAKFNKGKPFPDDKNKANAAANMNFGGSPGFNGGMASGKRNIYPVPQNNPMGMNPQNNPMKMNLQNNPMKMNPQNNPMVMNPQNNPMKMNPQNNPMGMNPQNNPMKMNPQNNPMVMNPQNNPMKMNPQNNPMKMNPQNNPMVMNPQNNPMKMNPQNNPYVQNNIQQEKRAFLIMNRTQKRIQINQSLFTIGRDSENLSFSINDNRHIGHRHAVIKRSDGFYYITDLNSVNHTFINGSQIQSGTDIRLNDNDILRFADEEFIFKLL